MYIFAEKLFQNQTLTVLPPMVHPLRPYSHVVERHKIPWYPQGPTRTCIRVTRRESKLLNLGFFKMCLSDIY